jgi:hypothetical protein
MKQYKKPAKFYLMLFLITFGIIGAYTIYLYFTSSLEATDIWNLFALPIIFTGIYFGGDYILQKIADKRYKTKYEDRFLELINQKMRESNRFLIEDFRRLQMNEKFQETLKMAFFIYQNGENEIFTINKLERKFDIKSIEGLAIAYAIAEIKEKLAQKLD